MSIGETRAIFRPGRAPDLRVVLNVAVEKLDAMAMAPYESLEIYDEGVRAVAKAMKKAMKMWLGEIPVDEMPVLNS